MSSPSKKPGDGTDQPDAVIQVPARGRKPYVKPAFVREEVFEATALACGKVNPTIRQCNLVRKTS